METKSGKQLTVVWHVDNLMSSCEDDFELTKFSCYMGRIYGPGLSMHSSKKHDYLGVDMEFCDNGALEVSMFNYPKNVIHEIKGRAKTPAYDKLFVIREDEDTRKLNEEQALLQASFRAQYEDTLASSLAEAEKNCIKDMVSFSRHVSSCIFYLEAAAGSRSTFLVGG